MLLHPFFLLLHLGYQQLLLSSAIMWRKLNFYFLNFCNESFIKHWKIRSSNSCNYIFISFVVHRNIMQISLYNS